VSEASPPAAPPAPEPALEAPTLGTPWEQLSRRRKVLRALAATFVVFHMGATMATMGPPGRWRNRFHSAFGWYTSKLRMATRWDMFGAPPDAALVVVEARARGGRRFLIADPFERGWNLLRRVVDSRLRKFHQKLKKKGHRRRWGAHYLEWLCRTHASEYPDLRDMRVIRTDPAAVNDDGTEKTPERTRSLLRHRCGDPPERARHEPDPPREAPGKRPARVGDEDPE
jgi:hypothetical protein